jgi:hypothetical protein
MLLNLACEELFWNPEPLSVLECPPITIGVSFAHDHTRTTPSFMLAVRMRSPALEYFRSVTALVCPESVARSLSFEGAEKELLDDLIQGPNTTIMYPANSPDGEPTLLRVNMGPTDG